MKVNKYKNKVLCLTLATVMALSGCGEKKKDSTENPTSVATEGNETTTMDTTVLLSSLREKYGATESEYADDILYVDRSQSIQIPIGFDPFADENFNWKDHFRFYQDAQMKYEFTDDCTYDYDYKQKILTITPPIFGAVEMDTYAGSDVTLDDLTGDYMSNEVANDNWGNLEQIYLVEDFDTETGASLEKPLINIVKINTELTEAPKVTYSCNEEGDAFISWNPVEGATEYLLFTVMKTEEQGLDTYTKTFARTSDTSWTYPQLTGSDDHVYIMNDFFRNFISSDDDLYGGSEDMNGDYFETMPEYIGVIAINGDGASPVSELMPVRRYAKLLVNELANNVNDTDIGSTYRENIADLPAEMSVTMCDGTTTKRVIDYDFDNAVFDVEGSMSLTIDGYAEGTKLYQQYLVAIENKDTMQQELDELRKRQEELKGKGGAKSTEMQIIDDSQDSEQTPDPEETPVEETTPETEETPVEETTPETEETPVEETTPETEETPVEETTPETEETPVEETTPETEETPVVQTTPETEETPEVEVTQEPEQTPTEEQLNLLDGQKVTANSALAEYIAIHLLGSAETVDLSMFTESRNTDIVFDAYQEATYQNPLILGIGEVGYDTTNHTLYVTYEDSVEKTQKKRQEVMDKADEIVSQIITDGMTDLDKEIAINTYLCEHAVYDDAALESAEANDFMAVDEEFNDSFTPYGVLVNGVGVCASYASAFKVLADEAGLDAIVVTGNLNGNLPHAWNRVHIDGQWVTVDATNNDNEQIQNALLNVSDEGINGVLVEDDRFVIDECLSNYACDSDASEYYHYTEKYYDLNSITDNLVTALQEDSDATLRTQYDISDEEFSNIAESVANESGFDIRGYYWLGVIHLCR